MAIMRHTLDPIPEQDTYPKQLTLLPSQPDHLTMPKADSRFDYLSNLKALLTALVIFHHTAIAYGGAGNLSSYPSPRHPPKSVPVLVVFNAVNQTFFMALFFFIAGFLSRGSLVRQMERDDLAGVGDFVKGRMWRLGGPTAMYSLLGPPMCKLIVEASRAKGVRWGAVWDSLTSVRGVRGPVWFCAVLLVFDFLLATFWTLKETLWLYLVERSRVVLPEDEDESESASPTVGGAKLFAALSLCSALDFLWRYFFPVNCMFTFLNLNMSYLPQYIAAYTLGVIIPDPMSTVPRPRILLALSAVSIASGFVLARDMSSRLGTDPTQDPTAGGFNTLAAAYGMWNNLTGYLIASILLRLFHQHINIPWSAISGRAYLAFLLHIPVSTLVEVLTEPWQVGPVTKTVCVGSANVVASWAASGILETVISMLTQKLMGTPAAAIPKHEQGSDVPGRRRTMWRGERAIEILDGLDEVGR